MKPSEVIPFPAAISADTALIKEDVAELKQLQQAVAAARVTGAATVVATANPAYLMGIMFDSLTVGLVTVKDNATTLQIIPVNTPGGQMIPLFGVKCLTNITVVLAGADVGTVYYIPVT